jgi:hypothetical protein
MPEFDLELPLQQAASEPGLEGAERQLAGLQPLARGIAELAESRLGRPTSTRTSA